MIRPQRVDSFTLIRSENTEEITLIGYQEYPGVIFTENGEEKIVGNKEEVLGFVISKVHAKSLVEALNEQITALENDMENK